MAAVEPPTRAIGSCTPPKWAAGLRADVYLRLRGLRPSTFDSLSDLSHSGVAISGSQLNYGLPLIHLLPRPKYIGLLLAGEEQWLTLVLSQSVHHVAHA